MISARSGVWLRSAGPGGCWWKPDGPLALHILAPCFGIWYLAMAAVKEGNIQCLNRVGQVDAMYRSQ